MKHMNEDVSLPQNETELSIWVALKLGLGRRDLPTRIWVHLCQKGPVAAALRPPSAAGVRACVEAARTLVRRDPTVLLDEPQERERPLVPRRKHHLFREMGTTRVRFLSEYLRERAEERPETIKLRKDHLGGSVLDPSAAYQFLESPALRILDRSLFEQAGIPIVGHQAEIIDETGGTPRFWSPTSAIRIRWNNGEVTLPHDFPTHRELQVSERKLSYPGRDGAVIERSVLPISVHDELRSAGRALTHLLPWKEHEAPWFLLTGVAPKLVPLALSVSGGEGPVCNATKITVEADPWVPADSIYRAYQYAQECLASAPIKPFKPRLVELFRFVSSRMRVPEGAPTWSALMREWNRRCTRDDDRYDDYRPFRRDYLRTERRLYGQVIYPKYKVDRAPTPRPPQRAAKTARKRASDRKEP